MRPLRSGDLVFVPCTDGGHVPFLPGVAVDASGNMVKVVVEGTKEPREVPRSDVRLRFARGEHQTWQDNTAMVNLNDATILENLHARHRQDHIYTYTASVLLAVNPYKVIRGLYGEEQCALYRGKHIGALPPHPYALADTAYRALVREQRNQGLLISGESGAGKTETAKIVMEFLAFTSGAASDLAAQIQSRVLKAQPILESFGNAVTMRNSNSSRFGKYNRVFFNEAGTLVDADITTYLLESSRVVLHADRERTYHCFYEMLAGLDEAQLKEFQLERNGRYRLMHNGKPSDDVQERDAKNFRRLCDALRTVGLDEEAIHAIFRVLAGLVHLGDLPKDEDFTPRRENLDDDERTVELNETAAAKAAALLGIDVDELSAAMKRRKVTVPGRESFHEAPRSPAQFLQALHSLIKAIYKRLFEHTVRCINQSFTVLRPEERPSTQPDSASTFKHIGILDIYGFERLQQNSFEQLCINLANERLQQYFVENVLVAEQGLYRREGLPWIPIELPDAGPVVNCISSLFRTLDDMSLQTAKGMEISDEQFCRTVLNDAAKDPQRKDVLRQFKLSNKRGTTQGLGLNDGFVMRHYAGPVEYTTKAWMVKNNDRLLPECEGLIQGSTFPLVKSLGDDDKGSKVPFRSIAKKYTTDLEALLQTLGTCNLHYIRCFKPNEEQKPGVFNQQLVLDQIIQCGTIELVKIMHDGYPNRCPFEEITTRFRDLLPESFQNYGMRTFIEALMLAYEVPREEWALGMSRLFLKAGQLRALEDMRTGGSKPQAETLARIVKGLVRRRWTSACSAVRLCLYLPKFLEQIYAIRAEKARLLALRRKLAGTFRMAVWLDHSWRKIKKARREVRLDQLSEIFRRAALIHRSLKPWTAAVRQRLLEAELKRQEEERLRREVEERLRREEEERLRLIEEERLRQEAELRRIEEERVRREEELRRLQEERLQRLEEERVRREEEERLRREEEERVRREEEERLLRLEEERKRVEEERRQLEEERRMRQEQEAEERRQEAERLQAERLALEAERRAFEALKARESEQHTGREAILQQASPQHKHSGCGPTSPRRLSQASSHHVQSGAAQELELGDSVSTLGMNMSQEEMLKRVQQLEMLMMLKQQEVEQQMNELLQKNRALEQQTAQRDLVLEHQREQLRLLEQQQEQLRHRQEVQLQQQEQALRLSTAHRHTSRRSSRGHWRSPSVSPERTQDSRRGSPLSLDDCDSLPHTPSPEHRSHRGARPSAGHQRSGAPSTGDRHSLISLDDYSARRLSSGSRREGRTSLAKEVLAKQAPKVLGEAAVGHGNLMAERAFWMEQRNYLLTDIYGSECSPGMPGRRARGQARGAAERPSAVPEEEPQGKMPQANLSSRFEGAEDSPLRGGDRGDADMEGPRRRSQAREPRRSDHGGSQLRAPRVFVNRQW